MTDVLNTDVGDGNKEDWYKLGASDSKSKIALALKVVPDKSTWRKQVRSTDIFFKEILDLSSDATINLGTINAGDTVTYTLDGPEGKYEIQVPIPGKFTVYNTLAVIAAARQLEIPMAHIVETLAQVKGVPGRVQSMTSPNGYSVLVDYAHTPDGLENVLETIKEFAKGRIITVFGCGGDRDTTKRPIMGKIAAQYSDHVIITSDNPRTEDPFKILDQVEEGVKNLTTPYDKIEDRETAIRAALKEAKAEDVVLIAGKGHENYQILKDRIIHFDDCEVVRNYLQEEQKCN